MKKFTSSFITLLLVISSTFAQKAGDMFISGSLNLNNGNIGGTSKSYVANELNSGFKGSIITDGHYDDILVEDLLPIPDENIFYNTYDNYDFNFSISPEFGYFIADNCLLKLGLGYDFTRSISYYDFWEEDKTPINPIYNKYGKRYDNEKNEWVNLYGVPFYNFTNLFTITPAFHYYVAITEKFYYTPGVSLTLGAGSYKTQDWESKESFDKNYTSGKWDDDDWDYYYDNRKKECDKDLNITAFRFSLNLHLLAFELRPAEHYAITLSAGEFGYIHNSWSNKEEYKYFDYYEEEYYDAKNKSSVYTNDVNLNLNLNLKVGFSYYF